MKSWKMDPLACIYCKLIDPAIIIAVVWKHKLFEFKVLITKAVYVSWPLNLLYRLRHRNLEQPTTSELFIGPTTYRRFMDTFRSIYTQKALERTENVARLKWVWKRNNSIQNIRTSLYLFLNLFKFCSMENSLPLHILNYCR